MIDILQTILPHHTWVSLPNKIFSRAINLPVNYFIFFLQLNSIPLHLQSIFPLSIHLLKVFSLPGYVNKAVKHMAEQVSIEEDVSSFETVPRSGVDWFIC